MQFVFLFWYYTIEYSIFNHCFKETSMKRINMTQLKVMVALAISVLTGSVQAANIYLENNYGAVIKYKCAKPNEKATEYAVLDGEISLVGEKGIRTAFKPVNDLSIRTTGIGSSYVSYFYDLGYVLEQIRSEERSHMNQKAIIVVNYTRGITGTSWAISLRWE